MRSNERSRKGGLRIPTGFADSAGNRVPVESGYLTPLGNGGGLAVMRQKVIAALVPGLNRPRNPTAVAGLVVPIIVDSVERVALGVLAHVRQKVVEGAPALAHGDSAPAVVVKVGGFRVEAARLDSGPDSVGGRGLISHVVAVPRLLLSNLLALHLRASARHTPAVNQGGDVGESLSSAVADTSPNNLATHALVSRRNGKKASESLIRYVC